MSSFQESTRAVTYKYNEKIKKACKHLFDSLNLNNFWYCKTTYDGFHSYLGSNIDSSDFFVDEKLYLNYPFYRDPTQFRSGISFFTYVQDKRFQKRLDFVKTKFNYHHTLLLMNKISDGIESFGFSSNTPNESQIPLLLNELPLLRLFARKFREENQFLFSCADESRVDLIKLMGRNFYEKGPSVVPNPKGRNALLKQLGIDPENSLSSREIDVTRLLLQGHSAGQVARRIYLSKRTVEHHIERIKMKLECSTKSELIQKARELENSGLSF